ncbi:unnamed protein product [Pylaiella littoralis]
MFLLCTTLNKKLRCLFRSVNFVLAPAVETGLLACAAVAKKLSHAACTGESSRKGEEGGGAEEGLREAALFFLFNVLLAFLLHLCIRHVLALHNT